MKGACLAMEKGEFEWAGRLLVNLHRESPSDKKYLVANFVQVQLFKMTKEQEKLEIKLRMLLQDCRQKTSDLTKIYRLYDELIGMNENDYLRFLQAQHKEKPEKAVKWTKIKLEHLPESSAKALLQAAQKVFSKEQLATLSAKQQKN
jgi:hypothetical protein